MKNTFLNTTNLSTRLVRFIQWSRIAFLVFGGVLKLLIIFPFSGTASKTNSIQKWSINLLKIFNITICVVDEGNLSKSPYLLVCNHISWLDIFAINAFKPVCFVAKSEVGSWPIFGWMAKKVGTIFIQRGSSSHTRKVVLELAEILKIETICIFPEGTSSSGIDVLPFRSNLFESAVISRLPVSPLAIQYKTISSQKKSVAPAFIGEMGLIESISNILNSPSLEVKLQFLRPILTDEHHPFDRKTLALLSHDSISRAIR